MDGLAVSETKKEYWKKPEVLKAHAERRRQKYHEDRAFAQAEKERARQAYLKKTGKEPVNTVRAGLEEMAVHTFTTYTQSQLSRTMGKCDHYVYTLVKKGRWPAQPPGGYTASQVKRLLTVFAAHWDKFSSYRETHTETRDALFAAMKED